MCFGGSVIREFVFSYVDSLIISAYLFGLAECSISGMVCSALQRMPLINRMQLVYTSSPISRQCVCFLAETQYLIGIRQLGKRPKAD